MGNLVQVYIARDLVHAYLVKGRLEEAGITVHVENESLQGVIGEVPAFVTAPRLVVEEADAQRALALIEEIDKEAQGDA